MCGRFTLRASTKELRNAFPFVDLPDLTARYNIAPTQQVAAIRLQHALGTPAEATVVLQAPRHAVGKCSCARFDLKGTLNLRGGWWRVPAMLKIMLCLGSASVLVLTTTPVAAQAQSPANFGRNMPVVPSRMGMIYGTITAVAPTTGTLTISPGQAGNSQVNLTVTSGTAITLDATANQGLSALAVGMRANALYQVNNNVYTAVRINASSKTQMSGVIQSISADGTKLTIVPSGQTDSQSFTITRATGVSVSGTKSTADHLLPGMQVKAMCQLGGSGNTALQIQASDKGHATGTITAVTAASGSTTAGTVTLTSEDQTTVTLNVTLGSATGSSAVTLDGKAVTALASLLPGMQAKASYQLTSSGNNVTRMTVGDKVRVHGTITAVTLSTRSTTAGTVTITPAQGTPVILNVTFGNGTTVRVNGQLATALNALQSGMTAEARYQVTSSGNNAIFLSARSGGS